MTYLSKRESEIVDVLHANGPLAANDIMEKLTSRRHNSTIRTQLRILEHKGVVTHTVKEGKFIFETTESVEATRKKRLGHLVEVCYGGDPKALEQDLRELVS